MENKTTEFSFILKSTEHGIGVFAVHDIKAETYLRLFGGEEEITDVSVVRNKKNVPDLFRQYCVTDRDEILLCPKDFGCMEIGWYLNHSKIPNAYHRDYDYYALHDIRAGEEITIDYNTLEEPEETKEDFYK